MYPLRNRDEADLVGVLPAALSRHAAPPSPLPPPPPPPLAPAVPRPTPGKGGAKDSARKKSPITETPRFLCPDEYRDFVKFRGRFGQNYAQRVSAPIQATPTAQTSWGRLLRAAPEAKQDAFIRFQF